MKKYLFQLMMAVSLICCANTSFAQLFSQQNVIVRLSGSTPASSWSNAGNPLFLGYGEQAVGNADYILSMASSLANARGVVIGRRSRGTLAAPAAVVNNDQVTSYLSSAYDGSAFQNPAAIDFYVDGTPTAGNVPVRLSLVTGTNSGNRTERLKVGNTGDFTFNANQMFLQKSTGRLGLGTLTPGGQLELSLDQARKPSTSTWTITSDARLKKIDGNYSKGLAEIVKLQPVMYHYQNAGERKFDAGTTAAQSYGFTAQDVQKVFPEAVGKDEDGYLNLNIHPILVAMVNAFKELNDKKEVAASKEKDETITKLQQQVDKQQQQIDMLMQKVSELAKAAPCVPVAKD